MSGKFNIAYDLMMRNLALNMDKFKENIFNLKLSYVFTQVWGDTSQGIDKDSFLAGQGMTEAYTFVLEGEKFYYVFFNGTFAYKVKKECQKFLKDLSLFNLKSQSYQDYLV